MEHLRQIGSHAARAVDGGSRDAGMASRCRELLKIVDPPMLVVAEDVVHDTGGGEGRAELSHRREARRVVLREGARSKCVRQGPPLPNMAGP